MSVLGRLEALRDIQRKGSVDYETLDLAISHITTLTQERDAARKVIGKIRALCDDWNNLARDTEPTMDCVGKVIEEADL